MKRNELNYQRTETNYIQIFVENETHIFLKSQQGILHKY